jgi:hypothetical protein
VRDPERIDLPLLSGEFNRPEAIRSRAQILFLSIVADKTPKPLYALRDEVLPRYREAFKVEREFATPNAEASAVSCHALVGLVYGSAMKDADLPKVVRDSRKEHPLIYAAGEELIRWSERFNLKAKERGISDRLAADSEFVDDYWPIATALETIIFWHFDPRGLLWEKRNPPAWSPPLFRLKAEMQRLQPEPESLPPVNLRASAMDTQTNTVQEIDAPGWYVTLEKKSEFRKRMSEAFDRWLDAHIVARENAALAAGLLRAPEKRKLVLQFTWLAKYQIDGASPEKLALEYKRSVATVEDGIEAALALAHLKKRPPARGGHKKGSRAPNRKD